MSSYYRFWIPLLFFALIFAACSDYPMVSQSHPFPVGSYQGIYSRTVQGTDSSIVQPGIWAFTANTYSMTCDLDHYVDKTGKYVCVCECGGRYTLGAELVLVNPGSSPLDSARTFRSCSGPYEPYGTYEVDTSMAPQILLTCVTQNPQGKTVTRTIQLIR